MTPLYWRYPAGSIVKEVCSANEGVTSLCRNYIPGATVGIFIPCFRDQDCQKKSCVGCRGLGLAILNEEASAKLLNDMYAITYDDSPPLARRLLMLPNTFLRRLRMAL